MHARDVAIVGAGLVGSLLAVCLKRRGARVTVWEKRADPRAIQDLAGRSINLILTHRGLVALERVGLDRAALELTVPVYGRAIHDLEGRVAYQPYGRDASERNHSIPRAGLNRFLIDAADERGVTFRFGHALEDFDPATGRLRLRDAASGRTVDVDADVVFGADGAGSVLRGVLDERIGLGTSTEFLDHGYKELTIPAGDDGTPRIRLDALHIWPRGREMLMALPNADRTFTGTLYIPAEGDDPSFAGLSSAGAVRAFFERAFPDAIALIPRLEEEFFENPTGPLGTVRCERWHVGGRVALLGDASHAIVPFFGQGMNAGFEDCRVLDDTLERLGDGDLEAVFAAWAAERKPNADAIADMAIDNFVEMRDRVGDPGFRLRKEVEHRLELELPDIYRSRYSMVVYSSIPYRHAQVVGRLQGEVLDALCADARTPEDVDLERARKLVRDRVSPYLAEHGVSLAY